MNRVESLDSDNDSDNILSKINKLAKQHKMNHSQSLSARKQKGFPKLGISNRLGRKQTDMGASDNSERFFTAQDNYKSEKRKHADDSFIEIGSQYQQISKDDFGDNILLKKKLFIEKNPIRQSGMPPYPKKFHNYVNSERNLQLKKDVKLNEKEKVEILNYILIQQSPKTLSRLERKILFKICKQGMHDKFRKQLWLRASGASSFMQMEENQNYYYKLKRLELSYPNPSFNQIELDLKRTFFELRVTKTEKLIIMLRNVLQTYCKRNPTIGYCQGMNFLVGRLLKVMKEIRKQDRRQEAKNDLEMSSFYDEIQQELDDEKDEEQAFWIFAMMVESILPIDYYSNMVGVLIDQKIFYDIFKLKMPDLCNHLQSVGFDPSLLAFQWFVCFLSYNLPQDVSNIIWDLFFLKGQKIIFRICLALLHQMKGSLMQTKDFAEIFEILESFPRKMIDVKTLIQTTEMPKFKVRNTHVKVWRITKRQQVETELQKLVVSKETFKGTYQRLKFLNKFYLYSDLLKYQEQNQSQGLDFYNKPLKQYEREVMTIFNCNEEDWPLCLYDFTYKNKIPQHLAFKTFYGNPPIIDNYFYGEGKIVSSIFEEELQEQKPHHGLMMEWGVHYCNLNPSFNNKFKLLYNAADDRLFTNENLLFTISDELKAQQSIKNFVENISSCKIKESDQAQTVDDSLKELQLENQKETDKEIISMLSREESKEEQQSSNEAQQQSKSQYENRDDNNLDYLDNMNDYQRHTLSVSALHMSALDIVTHNMDSSQIQKHKDTINKKLTCDRVYQKIKLTKSPRVEISQQKIIEFVNDLEKLVKEKGIAYDKWSQYHLNPNDFELEQVLAYVFVVDAMNFCFWPGNPAGEFEYENMTKNLAQILRDTPEFFKPINMSRVQAKELQSRVFENKEFSLMEERARIVREIGAIIHEEHGGSFVNFIEGGQKDVPTLVRKIIQNFSGFRDEAIYDGEQIFFYKRAQILISDLIGALSERESQDIQFKRAEELTMFADYRVPQSLRHVEIFSYNSELAEKIDNEVELAYSCKEEVEIRACTVIAVEMILDQIKKNDFLKDKIKYSYEVDWLLWQLGEKQLSSLKPHHKVLSIFY